MESHESEIKKLLLVIFSFLPEKEVTKGSTTTAFEHQGENSEEREDQKIEGQQDRDFDGKLAMNEKAEKKVEGKGQCVEESQTDPPTQRSVVLKGSGSGTEIIHWERQGFAFAMPDQ